MAKKPRYGVCKLCGELSVLTYEHVPPRSAFNNTPARLIEGREVLKSLDSDRLPWEFSDLRGRIQQQGKGGYFLCRKCNENSGSWYVPFFTEYVQGVFGAIYSNNGIEGVTAMQLRAESIRPLAIFKEIMVLFCDINSGCFGDSNLRSFLLEKNNTDMFDSKKYRVFCYIAKGPVFRMNGLSINCHHVNTHKPIFVEMTELSSFPLGFSLYIDLPDGYQPEGCEITSFSQFHYEDSVSCEITLPVLESNVLFSGDYRTKQEILNTIKGSNE